MRVQERQEQAELRCAYCHGRREGAMTWCAGCRALLHVGCRRELGACTTLGCSQAQRPARVREPERAHGLLIKTCAMATCIGWFQAMVQERLVVLHTPTPSDVLSFVVFAGALTVALGTWLGQGTGGRQLRGPVVAAVLQAFPVLTYLGFGVTGSSSSVHQGIWLVAGGVLVAGFGLRRFRPRA